MAIQCLRCVTDDDFARASLFVMTYKKDLHPAFTTMDTVSLLYSYMTEGHLLQSVDEHGRIVGVLAYYHGTPEEGFGNADVAFADMVLFDRDHRGTRLFIEGLRFWAGEVERAHPEVQELQFAALEENSYLCRLYAKFAEPRWEREGKIGKERVFCVKLHSLKATLARFARV